MMQRMRCVIVRVVTACERRAGGPHGAVESRQQDSHTLRSQAGNTAHTDVGTRYSQTTVDNDPVDASTRPGYRTSWLGLMFTLRVTVQL